MDSVQSQAHSALQHSSSSDARWSLVEELRRADGEGLVSLLEELASHASGRVLAAQLLAQGNLPSFIGRERASGMVRAWLDGTADHELLSEAICALGHLEDASAVGLIASSREHRDESVRVAVVFALGNIGTATAQLEVVAMADDPSPEVRSWVAMSLASASTISDPAQAAIRRLAIDDDIDTRHEALAGLARFDRAAASPLIEAELIAGRDSPMLREAIEARDT